MLRDGANISLQGLPFQLIITINQRKRRGDGSRRDGFSWGGEGCKERGAKAEGKSLPVEILKHHHPSHPDLCWKKRKVGPLENVGGSSHPGSPCACGSQIWLAVRITGRTSKNRNHWVPSSSGIKLVHDIGMFWKNPNLQLILNVEPGLKTRGRWQLEVPWTVSLTLLYLI